MRRMLQNLLAPIVLRHPRSYMAASNFYGYLDALQHTRHLTGPVVEVGVADGGTTALSWRFLREMGDDRPYIAIDTFGGFEADHLEVDNKIGLTRSHNDLFRVNTEDRFKRNLSRWNIGEVEIVKGDIAELSQIPENISVCLLDVDLKVPIYEGLKKLVPNLSEGGVLLVDDCREGTSWVGAVEGYKQYIEEENLQPKYFAGFGVITKGDVLPWAFSSTPNPDRSKNPLMN